MSAARNREFCYGGLVGGKARADSDGIMERPVNRQGAGGQRSVVV